MSKRKPTGEQPVPTSIEWHQAAQLPGHAVVELIQHQHTTVALSCAGLAPHTSDIFEPATCLFYVQQGTFAVEIGNQRYTIPANGYGLLRKFTPARTFTVQSPDGVYPKVYCFVLNDLFVRKLVQTVFRPAPPRAVSPHFAVFAATPLLDGLMQSIRTYVDQHQALDDVLLQLKTSEALLAIDQADSRLAAMLQEYSLAERADLREFMQHNYLRNVPLEELARQSGRSLATFNREFRFLFGETPSRWLKQRRLQQAYQLLAQGRGRPTEVYLQVGFEDLAHFSRSFKKQFQRLPSQVYAHP